MMEAKRNTAAFIMPVKIPGTMEELPFRASWGGSHVHFGTGIYANSNLTLLDDGHIYVCPNILHKTAI